MFSISRRFPQALIRISASGPTQYVRLMGIVSRLHQYVHAKHDAAKN
jgi:hypothetical protein